MKISGSWSATATSPVLDALALVAAELINHAPASTIDQRRLSEGCNSRRKHVSPESVKAITCRTFAAPSHAQLELNFKVAGAADATICQLQFVAAAVWEN